MAQEPQDHDGPWLTGKKSLFVHMALSHLSKLYLFAALISTLELPEHFIIWAGQSIRSIVPSSKLIRGYSWIALRVDLLSASFTSGLAAYLVYGGSSTVTAANTGSH